MARQADFGITEEDLSLLDSIDPHAPCKDHPGSKAKVLTLMRRYDCGVEFWHPDDKYHHGDSELDGVDLARPVMFASPLRRSEIEHHMHTPVPR